MGTQIKLENCKCGKKLTIIQNGKGAWIYCNNTRPWNFWKHYKTQQIAWFPIEFLGSKGNK